jgi:hypothetical protein
MVEMETSHSGTSTSSELVESPQPQTEAQTQTEQHQRYLSDKEIELLEDNIVDERNWRARGESVDPSILWNRATKSWEYRKCGRQHCRCKLGGNDRHGPYLVMIWTDLDSKYQNKFKRKYLGASKDFDQDKVLDDYIRKMAWKRASGDDRDSTATTYRKFQDVRDAAANGNKLAQEYYSKIRNHTVSVDWAYKILRMRAR